MLRLAYKVFSLILKRDNNKFVIALYRSDELDGNPKFIYDQIMEQIPNAKVHFVYSQNKMNLKLYREVLELSNASYLILDDYYLPIYLLKPRADLKVIQLWHAAGAFKKFGYSTLNTKFGPDKEYLKLVPIHSNYTNVYVSSTNIINYYAEAFNMSPSKIYALGIPRVDFFSNKQIYNEVRADISREYVLDRSINILVAPTYRAEGRHMETSINFSEVIIRVSSKITKGIRLIYKPHPYTSVVEINRLKACKNVLVVDKFSINEWMLVADAFLTDYSSAVFEFGLLEKPLAHFMPDYKEYLDNRGFYQDIREISDGSILLTEQELLNWLSARRKGEHFNTTRMINYNFDNLENISEKIVKHFTSE